MSQHRILACVAEPRGEYTHLLVIEGGFLLPTTVEEISGMSKGAASNLNVVGRYINRTSSDNGVVMNIVFGPHNPNA